MVTIAALTPRAVALLLSRRQPTAVDLESALTIARSLIASGRRVTFHHGLDALPTLAGLNEAGRWNRGLVIVGPLVDVVEMVDLPAATVAGPVTGFGMLAAVRIDGRPAMLVAESGGAHAARLLSSTALTATRGMATAVVRDAAQAQLAGGRVTFDALGIVPAATEVLRRTDLTVGINTLRLPARKRPARLLLDVMVAPDGSGEKAVVSAYVNERLLASTVAATGEATHLDIALPDGLVGTNANVRVAVQRRNGQGDCRFEPQGYPAQILGSSALVLVNDGHDSFDFSDLAGRWAAGIEVWLPVVALQRPEAVLGLVAAIS